MITAAVSGMLTMVMIAAVVVDLVQFIDRRPELRGDTLRHHLTETCSEFLTHVLHHGDHIVKKGVAVQ
jgi:hypothetical protein